MLPFEEPDNVIKITPNTKRFVKPTLDQIIAAMAGKGLPSVEAEKFWNHYESCGWTVGKNKKMVSWVASVAGWALRCQHSSGPTRKLSIRDLEAKIKAISERIRAIENRGTTDAMGNRVRNEDREEYRALKIKLREANDQIINYE